MSVSAGRSGRNAETERANTGIDELIENIKTLIREKNPLLSCIKYPKMLIRELRNLRNLVEMAEIKSSIVEQVKMLLVMQCNGYENHMLHCVLSGNPGTGKTTVAKILAHIWTSLGVIKCSVEKKAPVITIKSPQDLLVLSKKYDDIQRNNSYYDAKFLYVKEKLEKIRNLSKELRELGIDLRHEPETFEKWDEQIKLTRIIRFELDDVIRDLQSTEPKTPQDTTKDNSKDSPKEDNSAEDGEMWVDSSIDPVEALEEDSRNATFIIASRDDLIAEYTGQTAVKTRKVLEKARGGVLLIDEAYSLCIRSSSSSDNYGEECLTTINEFMSLYPDEIVIIFAGYKDKLLDSIFKVQPGLRRRCAWFFEIKDYSARGLAEIFKLQLNKFGWSLADNIDLPKFIQTHKAILPDGGGSIEKLVFQCKLAYSSIKFDETVKSGSSTSHDSVITDVMLERAISVLKRSADIAPIVEKPLHLSMYS